MNPKNHPNAATALGSSVGLGTLIVQIGAHYGWNISSQWSLALAGGLATVALWIGRHGFCGVWNFVKHGTSDPKGAK